MPEQSKYRPDQPWFEELAALARELLQRSFELLKEPVPDMFAGRKTQEPFPQEESKYLQPGNGPFIRKGGNLDCVLPPAHD